MKIAFFYGKGSEKYGNVSFFFRFFSFDIFFSLFFFIFLLFFLQCFQNLKYTQWYRRSLSTFEDIPCSPAPPGRCT